MPSFVDAVLGTSKVIEETTLVREQMKDDEATHKKELVCWHLESDREKMAHRIPNKVKSFLGLRRKDCKVEDHAVEIVVKMCRLHSVDMKELREEIDNDKAQLINSLTCFAKTYAGVSVVVASICLTTQFAIHVVRIGVLVVPLGGTKAVTVVIHAKKAMKTPLKKMKTERRR